MANQSLIIKKLIISEENFAILRNKIMSLKYESNTGDGFYVVQYDDEFLNAYYIYDVINSFNVYEAESNEFKKIQQKQQEYVSFFLDFNCQTVDIFGNKNKCSKLINALSKISEYKMSVDDVILEHTKIFKALADENIAYKVNRIKIKDYQFFDNIIGECTLNIEDYANVEWIFNKYKDNITQFSISVDFEQPTVFMFYKSGAITIYKDVKDIDISNIQLIKKCIV